MSLFSRSPVGTALLTASLVVYACTARLQSPEDDGGDGPTPGDGSSPPNKPSPSSGGAPTVDGGDGSKDGGNDGDDGGEGGASPNPGSGGSAPVLGEFVPCEVTLFLLQYCDRCHGSRGEELPRLTSWAEISIEASYIRDAVLGIGPNRMPPPPFQQISTDALAPLLDWIDAGTPYVEVEPTCF